MYISLNTSSIATALYIHMLFIHIVCILHYKISDWHNIYFCTCAAEFSVECCKKEILITQLILVFTAFNVISTSYKGQVYTCNICWRSYSHQENLYRHKRIECGKEAMLQCPECPFRTKHKHNLNRHIHRHINKWNLNMYVCVLSLIHI